MATTCIHCNSELMLDSRSLLVCQNEDCDFKFVFTEIKKPKGKNEYDWDWPSDLEIRDSLPKKQEEPKTDHTIWFVIGMLLLFLLPIIFCDGPTDEYYDPRSDQFRWG